MTVKTWVLGRRRKVLMVALPLVTASRWTSANIGSEGCLPLARRSVRSLQGDYGQVRLQSYGGMLRVLALLLTGPWFVSAFRVPR